MVKERASRLVKLKPDDLSQDQAVLYDEIVFGPRSKGSQQSSLVDSDGALRGPFNAMLLAPKLGHALSQLGTTIRYFGELSGRIREAVILMVAKKWECDFERSSHEPLALEVGLTDEDLSAISQGGLPSAKTPSEATAFWAASLLLGAADLDDLDFERCVRDLGEKGIFELTTLIGYYSTLALQMRIFGI
ncbi:MULTISPECIES: carboxymuconolactone decarboxylase family protein [Acidithrix]|uniref:Carboxymuconolactone decarboxylase-like domain-containing protein n=1 Tax=Acidithrix ferrooxidans TaxID=1280514 RepID=A0A0D8HGG7_9ACTN|nr:MULTISPECIES: carboxymuconolactone decarboxylase family protein [Acidithrix]KJF16939.1 hypothetical protein AXFE_22220 [Acidithrix ferrooxidans]CAG4904125.1 unnamed protein product [Acidithrix sp. C25]